MSHEGKVKTKYGNIPLWPLSSHWHLLVQRNSDMTVEMESALGVVYNPCKREIQEHILQQLEGGRKKTGSSPRANFHILGYSTKQ